MKKLPIFTLVLVLLGAAAWQAAEAWQETSETSPADPAAASQGESSEPVAQENTRAVELLREARERLFQRESVQAQLSQFVSLGDYKFRSSGSYLSASNFRYRLEYRVELADMEGTFLEVCDGQILHTRRHVGKPVRSSTPLATPTGDVELTRRDIQRILRETRQRLDVPEALHAAEIGIGGLPAVLASLERSMVFDALRSETIEGREYVVIQGRWNDDRRTSLLSGLGGVAGQVANFLPDMVRIYLEKETLFPERILYLKLVSEERKTYRPMLTVEFSDIRLDQPVPPQAFVYVAPPGIEERDETAFYLELIKGAAAGNRPPSATPADPL